MKNKVIQLIILCTCSFFFSCKAQPTPILTFEKSNDPIRLPLEAVFVIQLESSYGNGHEWQLKNELETALLRLDSTSVTRTEDNKNKALSATADQIWEKFHFKTIEKGTMRLYFEQRRVWDESSVQDSTSFRIIVE